MINAAFNMGQPWPHAKRWLSLGRAGAQNLVGLLLKPTLRSTLCCGRVLEEACERDLEAADRLSVLDEGSRKQNRTLTTSVSLTVLYLTSLPSPFTLTGTAA